MNNDNSLIEMISNEFSNHRFERIMPLKAIKASVLMPLVKKDGELSLLFEVRSRNIEQGGEICFPGGRIETGESPADAALRETKEELCLADGKANIIAPMFKMIGPAGADVFAYLGRIDEYEGTYSEAEVASVFSISIKELMKIEPKVSDTVFVQTPQEGFHYELIPNGRDYPWADIKKRYFFYETEFGVIWGMTGELLHKLLESFSAAGIEAYI